jgi:hypothetical protein
VLEVLEGRALVAGFAAAIALLIRRVTRRDRLALLLVFAYGMLFARLQSANRCWMLAEVCPRYMLDGGMLLPAAELVQLTRARRRWPGTPARSFAGRVARLFLPFPRGAIDTVRRCARARLAAG